MKHRGSIVLNLLIRKKDVFDPDMRLFVLHLLHATKIFLHSKIIIFFLGNRSNIKLVMTGLNSYLTFIHPSSDSRRVSKQFRQLIRS